MYAHVFGSFFHVALCIQKLGFLEAHPIDALLIINKKMSFSDGDEKANRYISGKIFLFV